MTTVESVSPTAELAVASYREDLVTAGAGIWLILALFSDGWAHLNVPELESFFTPWHGALYSGFAVAATWVGVLAIRRGGTPAEALRAPVATVRRLPAGYPLAAVGVVVFGLGGVLDLLWHTAFGVEEGIDALLSPSHLTLFTGGALLLSAPVRGAWLSRSTPGTGFGQRLPELLSLTLTTGLAAFFLLYLSVFVRPGFDQRFQRVPEGAPGHQGAELPAILTAGSYLITTALLVVPVLLLAARGQLPRGAITMLVGGVAWLSVALDGFSRVGVALAVTAAAVVVDALARRWDAVRGIAAPGRLVLLGATLPAVLWPALLLALALTDGVRYPVALWTGVPVLAVLTGLVLGMLATPGRRSTAR